MSDGIIWHPFVGLKQNENENGTEGSQTNNRLREEPLPGLRWDAYVRGVPVLGSFSWHRQRVCASQRPVLFVGVDVLWASGESATQMDDQSTPGYTARDDRIGDKQGAAPGGERE
jgi:hypothetical protein